MACLLAPVLVISTVDLRTWLDTTWDDDDDYYYDYDDENEKNKEDNDDSYPFSLICCDYCVQVKELAHVPL